MNAHQMTAADVIRESYIDHEPIEGGEDQDFGGDLFVQAMWERNLEDWRRKEDPEGDLRVVTVRAWFPRSYKDQYNRGSRRAGFTFSTMPGHGVWISDGEIPGL